MFVKILNTSMTSASDLTLIQLILSYKNYLFLDKNSLSMYTFMFYRLCDVLWIIQEKRFHLAFLRKCRDTIHIIVLKEEFISTQLRNNKQNSHGVFRRLNHITHKILTVEIEYISFITTLIP